MEQNPYQSPSEEVQVVGVRSGDPEDLRKIAQYQKGVIGCLLVNIVLVILLMGLQASPDMVVPVIVLNILYIGVSIAGLVFVVLLASKVYSLAPAILLGVLMLVPCISLIVLLMVNQKATSTLQQNGIKVGFFGAKT